MATEFHARVSSVIHGRYTIDGTSTVYLHADQPQRRQGVELHEWVHSELLDNTAYGRFQQMLDTAATLAPAGAFRDRCRELLDLSMTACAVAHEGLAAYREVCWLAAHEGADSAAQYLVHVPPDYRQGIELVSNLLGSPFSEPPYQGLIPPAFHTLLIALGSAVMNTPILAEYADPERIFREPLSWLLIDGPNQRLEELHDHAALVGETVRRLAGEPLTAAVTRWQASQEGGEIEGFWNLVVETLRRALHDLPMLTKSEYADQAGILNERWVGHLNRLAGRKVAARGARREDVSGQRRLNIRLYPASFEGTEAASAQENAILVESEFLVGLSEGRYQEDLFRLGFLATFDPDPPLEGFLDQGIMLLGVPMRAESPAGASPWDSDEPSIFCETTVERLLESSAELADLGWCWYTHQTIVVFLRHLGRLPQGLVFERCPDPGHVLLGVDHALRHGQQPTGYWIGPDEEDRSMIAVVHRHLFSFSFVTTFGWGLDDLEQRMAERGLSKLGAAATIGARRVPLDRIARWARWGALGS